MKKAIVTLAIGAQYLEAWTKICRKGWAAYCDRHGYDLVAIEQPLDVSARARSRSPAWQKCLVLSQDWSAKYDRLVWVDSDLAINPAAPSIIDGVPEAKIGAMDDLTYPTAAEREAVIRFWMEQVRRNPAVPGHWELGAEAFHTRFGLPGGQKHIVQTGVMVLSPMHHRAVMEHVYNTYDDPGPAELNYEMRPLSHEIQTHGLQHFIDPRFNALMMWLIWIANLRSGREPTGPELHNFVTAQYLRNHFLHFAGCRSLMQMLAAVA
jgi:hypothetical protein